MVRNKLVLPFWTQFEGEICRFRPLDFLVSKIHSLRKRYHARRIEREDRRCSTSLRNYEHKVFSQYGEDGVIEEIFRRIGHGEKFVVEFGIESGVECNARYLIEKYGWAALLIDGCANNVESATRLYADHPVKIIKRFLTRDNILDVFEEAGVPKTPDLFSIDIDGNDYWLIERVLTVYRPRVFVTEYNARWIPPYEWIMPYDDSHVWDGTVCFGASLQSFAKLAGMNGYRLVTCTKAGLNAFFVREDELGEHFSTAAYDPVYHYAAPMYNGKYFGHPVRK